LWSEFLAIDPEVWVRFPALPDFMISGSGPHAVNATQTQLINVTTNTIKVQLKNEAHYTLNINTYEIRGPGSIPGTSRIKKVVGLERGPLSLVSTTEELLDRKVAAPV
jgi:hypothetical protein